MTKRSNLIPRVLKRIKQKIEDGSLNWEDIEGDFQNEKSITFMCSQYDLTRTEVKVLKEYYFS
jgi:uncharacterized membrane protein